MKVALKEEGTSALSLTRAILLYGDSSATIAVAHPVVHTNDGPPTLGAGIFATQSLVTELLDCIESDPLSYIPANVIAFARNAVAWFEPARKRTMFFRPDTDSAVAAFDGKGIHQPPLVFVAARRSLFVYALQDNERPTKNAQLCYAPYWNVSDRHSTCFGTMAVPSHVLPESVDEWTTAFFKSEFTHISGRARRWAHPGTYAQLLTAAATGPFSPEWLIPANVTIAEALCSS